MTMRAYLDSPKNDGSATWTEMDAHTEGTCREGCLYCTETEEEAMSEDSVRRALVDSTKERLRIAFAQLSLETPPELLDELRDATAAVQRVGTLSDSDVKILYRMAGRLVERITHCPTGMLEEGR